MGKRSSTEGVVSSCKIVTEHFVKFVTDCYRAFCKVCDKELIAGVSELKKHQNQSNTKAKKQL